MDDDTILACLLGDLEGAEAQRARAEIDSDPSARARAGTYRALLDTLASESIRAAEQPAVPPTAVGIVEKLFQLRRSSWLRPATAKLEQELAVLVKDSFGTPGPVLGFRGGEAARVLEFESEGCSAKLHISPDELGEEPGSLRVTGEVIGLSLPCLVGFASLTSRGTIRELPVDDEGLFALTLPEGDYCLRLTGGDRVVLTAPQRLSLAP